MPYPMQEQWLYKAIPNLTGGLDQSKQSDQLNDTQCVMLRDVRIENNAVISSRGYIQYGDSDGAFNAFTSSLQAVHQFNMRDGTSELLAITLTAMYKYNSTLDKWIHVAGPLYTTTTAAYVAGATVIAITVDPGFVIGYTFAIVLDNGDIHTPTITNIAGLNITINAGIPTGRTVAIGAAVYRPVILTGTVNKLVSIVDVPGSDWMVFTNGVNAVKRWNGTSCESITGATTYVCRAVALYNTALFLIGTTEGGTSYPQRVRRSNQTDPTDWTGGTAGYDDLLDTTDAVVCGKLLGPYLIIYKTRGIVRCSFIGSSGLNYQYETMITHEGAVTTSAVCTVKDRHVFIGHNNVYEYAGDFTIKPIGDQIRPTLFSDGKNVSSIYDYIMFIMYIEKFDEVWVFYPRLDFSSTSACNYAFRYSVNTGVWYDTSFAYPVRGGTVHRTENADGEIDFHLLQDLPFKRVVIYDPTTWNDPLLVPIPFTVETKDFIMPDGRFRVDMVEMNIGGTSVLFEYSTDSGTTYTTMATITQTTQIKIRVHKQFVCDKVRFRWTGAANNFKLSWFGFSYKIENLYIAGSNTY